MRKHLKMLGQETLSSTVGSSDGRNSCCGAREEMRRVTTEAKFVNKKRGHVPVDLRNRDKGRLGTRQLPKIQEVISALMTVQKSDQRVICPVFGTELEYGFRRSR
jgi:hypothetical protein